MPLFMFYVWEQDYFGTTHLPSATTSRGPKATFRSKREKKVSSKARGTMAIDCEQSNSEFLCVDKNNYKNPAIVMQLLFFVFYIDFKYLISWYLNEQ